MADSPFSSRIPADQTRPMQTCSRLRHCAMDHGVQITRYMGQNASMIVPSALGGQPVRSIGDYVFSQHRELRRVSLPAGLHAVGTGAFWICSGLEEVIFRPGLCSIGDDAFCGCGALRQLILPEEVQLIGHRAFARCGSLFSLNLPDALTTLHADAFQGCFALRWLLLSPLHPVFALQNNALIRKTDGEVLFVLPDAASCGEYAFPSGVRRIGAFVLSGREDLHSLVLPEGVEELCQGALCGLKNLRTLHLPASLRRTAADVLLGLPSNVIITAPDGSKAQRFAQKLMSQR